jgi:hypothetical protein
MNSTAYAIHPPPRVQHVEARDGRELVKRQQAVLHADTYDWRIDGVRSYETWCAAKREQGIRAGLIKSRNEREQAWADAGPVSVRELEAGR